MSEISKCTTHCYQIFYSKTIQRQRALRTEHLITSTVIEFIQNTATAVFYHIRLRLDRYGNAYSKQHYSLLSTLMSSYLAIVPLILYHKQMPMLTPYEVSAKESCTMNLGSRAIFPFKRGIVSLEIHLHSNESSPLK